MNRTRNKLRDAVLISLAASAATTGSALAQEQEATTLDRVSVTGSRIKRVDLETSQPVFTMDREQIAAQGQTSIGDIIQNISVNGSSLNSSYNNGGNGENRVNLRNLGSSRTLVLVNGRRWVGGTGLGGAVDLNTIPTAAVERIEVLKDGASTIYGSDAIAGVVNIILRQNFDGAEANAYFGQYDKGDGSRQSYDFTIGSAGERWHATLGVGYVKEDPVWAGNRKISAVPTYGALPNTGNSSTTPEGRFGYYGQVDVDEDGKPVYASTLPDGSAGYFLTGDGGSTWRPYTSADSFNHAPGNLLLTPQERTSVFADAGFSITDNVRFKSTVTYNERKSEQILAAMPITLGRVAPGTNGANIVISADNIYNNTGRDIDYIQYRAMETGGRIYKQNVKTYGFNGGLEGDFEIGSRFWNWEAGMFYGKNDQTDITTGFFNISALRNALGPSFIDADGIARCGTSSSVIDGCVPMDMLSGAGSLTPDMIKYAGFTAHDVYGYEQKTYYGSIGGELFDLPGGALAFSLGLEHRNESGFDDPDALINSGDTTGNARTATSGGYSLDEAYLELAIPLLSGVTGAQLLDFSVATRFSDYSNFGDTTNSKFGFRWKPIHDLMVRGNWSQGFRAPSISELFSGVSDTFENVKDPCAGSVEGVANPASPASCAGVPRYPQANSQIRTTVGGNTQLGPETSVSKTLGFVYSPSFVQGLDVSVDWWNIKIEDAIYAQTAQQMLNACYDKGVSSICSLITRDPTGQIANMQAVPNNVGTMEVEGWDVTFGYRLPETRFGSFNFVLDTTYTSSYTIEDPVTEASNRVGNYLDRDNYWRIRSNALIAWQLGDFGANLAARYYSSQVEDCTGSNFTGGATGNFGLLCSNPDKLGVGGKPDPQNKIPSVTYTDLSGYWKTPWNGQITIGVNNAFDRDPPKAYTTFANSFDPQYEIPGRFFYMRYNQKF